MSKESEYWWFVRCYISGTPFVNEKGSFPIDLDDDLEPYPELMEYAIRLQDTWRTDKRVTYMVRAHQHIDYKSICTNYRHPWHRLETLSLREAIVFEELARQKHIENNQIQLLGLLSMLVNAEDRQDVVEVLDLTCIAIDPTLEGRLGSATDKKVEFFTYLQEKKDE